MPRIPWAEGDEHLAARQKAFNERLGELIASQRQLRGMLQDELAGKIGMSRRQWQRLEAGQIKHSPTVFFVKEIADHLGVPLASLLPSDLETEDLSTMEPPAAG